MDRLATLARLGQYQDYQKYADVERKRLPPGTGSQPTEEMKAELAARKAVAARTEAEWKAQREANPELYSSSVANNTYYATNVASLPERAFEKGIDSQPSAQQGC